jgi:hypothetical protein
MFHSEEVAKEAIYCNYGACVTVEGLDCLYKGLGDLEGFQGPSKVVMLYLIICFLLV